MIRRASLISIFFLASCGGDGDSDPVDQIADLQGDWAGECAIDGDSSERDELSITGNDFVFSTATYINQTNCSGLFSINVNFPGTFIVNGTTTEVTEGQAKHLDLTYSPTGNISTTAATAEILESQGTSIASLFAAQGITDINNVPLEVLGVPQSDIYSIYLVVGNDLYTGSFSEGLDGTSPDLRPVSVDNDFTRQ